MTDLFFYVVFIAALVLVLLDSLFLLCNFLEGKFKILTGATFCFIKIKQFFRPEY